MASVAALSLQAAAAIMSHSGSTDGVTVPRLSSVGACKLRARRAHRVLQSSCPVDKPMPQPSFRRCLNAANSHLPSSPSHRTHYYSQKICRIRLKDRIQIATLTKFTGSFVMRKEEPLLRSIATLEPNFLVASTDDETPCTDGHYDAISDFEISPSTCDDALEVDDKEKLRRMRISRANKGIVPWNKGRKHSPETIRRIRERTRLAMQNPKVKMKLVNLGHAQSEETRTKISVKVREGWQRRREKLMSQGGCLVQWQNLVAKAARQGLLGESELQWDSFGIVDEQLKQEWLESIEKRKRRPKPQGSRRAPKSMEQRRKISEAIAAKWADPAYRERVCTGLANYHGTSDQVVQRRRKTSAESSSKKMPVTPARKMPVQISGNTKETVGAKLAPIRRKSSAPSYKDPMASAKLEMIKQIRTQRAALEMQKFEAIERAKLLIQEAEKACEALVMAAARSSIARASLMETRKLIVEATRAIEGLETGQVTDSTLLVPRPLPSVEDMTSENSEDTKLMNGRPVDQISHHDESIKLPMINGTRRTHNSHNTDMFWDIFVSTQPKSEAADIHCSDSPTSSPPKDVNGMAAHGKKNLASEAGTKKKWVLGRLVEVKDGI